jgi:transposase
VQQVTGGTVELAYVDQGYTGPTAAQAAQQHGLRLEVVKHPMAKRGFAMLPRRWVVERSFAWAARFRRLARDYERLDTSLKGLICSPSPLSCSAISQIHSNEVPNRL